MGVRERRAMEKEARRNQILDAARDLLFTQGIHQVSISKISKASQLAVGTLYFHFKNKEEIFIALQQEGLDLLYTIIAPIVSQPILSEGDKLRQVARAYLDFSREQEAYFTIINAFLSSPRVFFLQDQKAVVDQSGNRVIELIRQLVEEGCEKGVFQEREPARFAVFFWGGLHGLLQFKKFEQTILGGEAHETLYFYSVEKMIQSIQIQP